MHSLWNDVHWSAHVCPCKNPIRVFAVDVHAAVTDGFSKVVVPPCVVNVVVIVDAKIIFHTFQTIISWIVCSVVGDVITKGKFCEDGCFSEWCRVPGLCG